MRKLGFRFYLYLLLLVWNVVGVVASAQEGSAFNFVLSAVFTVIMILAVKSVYKQAQNS